MMQQLPHKEQTMTRAALVLLAFLPLALAAQEKDPSLKKNQTKVVSSTRANMSSKSDDGSSTELETGTDFVSSLDTNAPQQPSAKPPQPPKPLDRHKLKIPGSMVGYIENAVIGTQVRVRFDAAFHDNAPDRAEFFYAQCSCISGPGPNPVVADLNFQQLYMYAEYAPVKRFSFFADVPVRWIQPQSIAVPGTPPLTNEVGLSDVAAGFKLAALASSNQYLTFQFQAYFATGNASTGLGTNHYSAEPALLYYLRFSDRIALEAQVGDSHPIGGSSCPQPCNTNSTMMNPPLPNSQGFAGDVFFYGLGPSYVLYRGENVQIAPAIELVGWRELGGFVTDSATAKPLYQEAVSADRTNIVNLKVGARTMVGAHNSFYIGYGHQLTHAVWYKEIVRAEYRYTF
jgi:hypothetical protein